MKIILTIMALGMGVVSLTGCPEVQKKNCEAIGGSWDSDEQLCDVVDPA